MASSSLFVNISAVPRTSSVGDFPTNFQFLSYSKNGSVDCIELDISLSSGARFIFLYFFLELLSRPPLSFLSS